MGGEAPYDASHFEVRCPRCDVSFAPETRRCIHCGGPTSKPGPNRGRDWVHTLDASTTASTADSRTDSATDSAASSRTDSKTNPAADSMTGWTGRASRSGASAGPGRGRASGAEAVYSPGPLGGQDQDDAELGAEAGAWPGRLLRTFGSLIWIVVLVAFTLIRNCSSER